MADRERGLASSCVEESLLKEPAVLFLQTRLDLKHMGSRN
jgi:hypothetical protein